MACRHLCVIRHLLRNPRIKSSLSLMFLRRTNFSTISKLQTPNCLQYSKPLPCTFTCGRLKSSDAGSSTEESKGNVVYEGTITSMVKAVKMFSLSTSIVGVGMQPLIWRNAAHAIDVTTVLASAMVFSIICMPVMLHFITKKYVVKLHYNAETGVFNAETISFFLQRLEHSFSADEAEFAETSGLFTSFKVGRKAFFIDPNMFLDRSAYVRLMGLDKPFEWEKHDYKEQLKRKKE